MNIKMNEYTYYLKNVNGMMIPIVFYGSLKEDFSMAGLSANARAWM